MARGRAAANTRLVCIVSVDSVSLSVYMLPVWRGVGVESRHTRKLIAGNATAASSTIPLLKYTRPFHTESDNTSRVSLFPGSPTTDTALQKMAVSVNSLTFYVLL